MSHWGTFINDTCKFGHFLTLLLYFSTSVWVLPTSNACQNKHFGHVLASFWCKMIKHEMKMSILGAYSQTLVYTNRLKIIKHLHLDLNYWPFGFQVHFNHSGTGLVQYSDPHCSTFTIFYNHIASNVSQSALRPKSFEVTATQF